MKKEAIRGIHHVTAIAGAPQRNLDFYEGFLGLRLVKKTANFDDPGTYHLYYGDEAGRPGTILSFFSWEDAVLGRVGGGMASAASFSVPDMALDYWMGRFADEAYRFDSPEDRFGEQVVAVGGPDGLRLEFIAHLVEDTPPIRMSGTVPPEHALRGFHSVTLALSAPERTARLLTEVFGFKEMGEERGRIRLRALSDEPGGIADLVQTNERGRPGAGTVHHVAFRARDAAEQLRWRDALSALGLDVSEVRDRLYFQSIYFREPGGVLFEIATDPPGFTIDETLEDLGTSLKLPPWLEPRRARLERRLQKLRPHGRFDASQ